MGLDFQGFNHLLQLKNAGVKFGDVLTLGRQGNNLKGTAYQEILQRHIPKEKQQYCDDLLKQFFGATSVSSMDFSDYEDASILHDMNKPVAKELYEKYDTILDLGTLEHVYNINQALQNCSKLCKLGGYLIHILPANNYCGHGFWQFSPELFFSLYSEKNGYRNTEVFVARRRDKKHRFAVSAPVNGKRVNLASNDEIYVLVSTQKHNKNWSHDNVQQSDYVAEWAGVSNNDNMNIGDHKAKTAWAKIMTKILPRTTKRRMKMLTDTNPHLRKITINASD